MWNVFLKGQVEAIKARIAAGGGGPSHVYTTGHSLGAVNAQYAAAAIRNVEVPVDGVYAFASPHTGGLGDLCLNCPPGAPNQHSWVDRYK